MFLWDKVLLEVEIKKVDFLDCFATLGIPLAISLVKKVLGKGMRLQPRGKGMRLQPRGKGMRLQPRGKGMRLQPRGKGMRLQPPLIFGSWDKKKIRGCTFE